MMSPPAYYIDSLDRASIARIMVCKECKMFIADMDQFLSKGYSGLEGSRAGLFEDVSNVNLGERQVWLMSSGAYTVRELTCIGCGAYIGWRFVCAHDPSQKWKNGAFVLERDSLSGRYVYESSSYCSDRPLLKLDLKAITDLDVQKRIRKKSSTNTLTTISSRYGSDRL